MLLELVVLKLIYQNLIDINTAGTNMNRVLRFKYHINSNLWIRNNYSGTDFNYSQINGYLMYISE